MQGDFCYMKKMIVLIILVTLVTITYTVINLEDIVEGEDIYITFYVMDEIYLPNVITNRGGIGYELKAKIQYADEVRATLKDIKGESVTIKGNIATANDILKRLNATIITEGKIDNITFINAYTRNIRNYVMVDREKINIQIAVRDNGTIIIGTPVIFGSC